MARVGDVIENPVIGDRVTFLEVAADTGGEGLRFEWVVPPGFSVPEHVHPRQEERHEVLSGTLWSRVGGQERTLREGEWVAGPAGVPHAWRNSSREEELRLLSELRPALHMETVIERTAEIMRDLKNHKMGALGHLLRFAVLTHETRGDFYFSSAPVRASMKLLEKLAPLGRLLGYEAHGRRHDATGTQVR